MLDSYLCRQFFGTLFSPYVCFFLLLTVVVIWIVVRSNSRLMKSLVLFIWIIFFIGSTGWFSTVISQRFERRYPVVTTVNPNVHWVVVLGGGVLTGVDAPANYLLLPGSVSRLIEGVRLYRQLPQATLLLSGGDRKHIVTQSTAWNMAQLAGLFKIPKESIVVEPFSLNTAEEAVTIKRRIGKEPFYLVTSAMHLPRAMALCHKQGLHPLAAPSDFPYPYEETVSWKSKFLSIAPSHWTFIQGIWHEVLGTIWGKMVRQL